MADQNSVNLDINAVMGGSKEGAPVAVQNPNTVQNSNLDAAVTTAAREEKEAQEMLQAREVILAAERKEEKTELAGIDQTRVAGQAPPELDMPMTAQVEMAAPVKQEINGVTIEGTTNAEAVAAVSQDLQKEYLERMETEKARAQIEAQNGQKVAARAVNQEAGVAEIVVNGLKQQVETEAVMKENLQKSPDVGMTWRAWLSKKLRDMWSTLIRQEKSTAVTQATQEKKIENQGQ